MQDNSKCWWGKELKIYPCKDSDAGIGFFVVRFKTPDCIHGYFYAGLYFGKFLLDCDFRRGLGWCNYFATGCGG